MSPIATPAALRVLSTGAPRLYSAARRAGATRVEALSMVADSALVLVAAARRSPGDWREQNAIRHFTWQAWLTARYGADLATALAAAQEHGSSNAADSRVDEHNNRSGQEYGAAHAPDLLRRGRRGVSTLLGTGTEKFRAGQLAGHASRRAGRRRRRAGRRAVPGPPS